jgi:serine/threonine protein kinase/Flp pilus assembly protein TadD
MTESNADRDPIELLADSFVGRLRAGQRPSIAEYAERYPDLAGDIQELLPALVELEQNASADSQGGGGAIRTGPPPQQLGEYTIVREIGRGGMGVVYEAVQESLGRHVALKVLQVGGLCGAQLERFRREAKAAARLHHTNIVPVYGISEHAGVHYYAMQFIQGQSLNLVIDELRRQRNHPASENPAGIEHIRSDALSDSPDEMRAQENDSASANGYAADVPLSSEFSTPASADEFYRSVARVGLQVAEALAYAHSQGILHRDIKPSNLLLDGRGTVWVTDFGLAKSDRADDLTDAGDVVGTLHYMAPERLDGKSDPRSDVYGLGATLYELVALQPLFHVRARAKLIEHILYEEPLALRKCDRRIPRDLETIVEKALLKEPSERYASAQQMADDLRLFLADRTIRARRTTTAERMWRWRRRNPALATVTAALLLVTALGFAGVAWKWRDAEIARQDEHIAREEADRRADEIRQGHERLKQASSLVDVGARFAESGGWDDAAIAFSEAIRLRPELASGWEKRGELYYRLGLFELATADLQNAFKLHRPSFHVQWLRLALLYLHVGDTDGYRQVRDLMQKNIFGTADPNAALSLARTCLLMELPEADTRQWTTLAEKSLAAHPAERFRYVLSIAQFRAGQYEEAIALCTSSADNRTAPELNYPLLAMAHARLGSLDQARTAFAAAAQSRDKWIQALFLSGADNWVVHQGATATWPIDLLEWLEFELHLREAANLLDMPIPTVDARLHVLQGRAYAGLRQRDKAAEEYRRALALQPDDERIRYEAYGNRAHQLIKLERFTEAAGEFANALEFAPSDSHLWSCLATAQLAAGNAAAYRQTCAAMFDLFARDSNRSVLFRLAWTCTLMPDALADMPALAPVAEAGAGWWIDSQRVLVASHYRLGRHEDAIRSLELLSQVAQPEPASILFAAMAHYQLGQRHEARQKLSAAVAAITVTQEHSTLRNLAIDFDPRGWTEKVTERLLRKEAEALILGGDY